MLDVRENGLRLLGILIEAKATGPKTMLVNALQSESGLSEGEFGQAETYLLDGGFVRRLGGGDAGQLWATAAGIDCHASDMRTRYPLSTLAKRAASLILHEGKPEMGYVVFMKRICDVLGIDSDTYVKIMKELADWGFAEDATRSQQQPFSGVVLTDIGRRAVRDSFRREGVVATLPSGVVGGEPPAIASPGTKMPRAHARLLSAMVDVAIRNDLREVTYHTDQSGDEYDVFDYVIHDQSGGRDIVVEGLRDDPIPSLAAHGFVLRTGGHRVLVQPAAFVLARVADAQSASIPADFQRLQPYFPEFFRDHPDEAHNVFLMMRFREGDRYVEIHEALRRHMKVFGLNVVRADDRAYTDDLWDNVRLYMLGSKYGVAVFEQIDTRDFNPRLS